MFTKLHFRLDNIEYHRLKGDFFEGYGDTFRQYFIKDEQYLDSLINNKIKFNILPNWSTCCEISDYGAMPHVDHNSVALNYYIDASDYVTVFYETKDNSQGQSTEQIIDRKGLTRTNDVRSYQYSELKIISKFKANAHEAYLLNIKKIHSANNYQTNAKTRTMLRWAWDNSDFETIKNSIQIL